MKTLLAVVIALFVLSIQAATASDIVSVTPMGDRIVTKDFRDRFNALVDLYAARFAPPLLHDSGFAIIYRRSHTTTYIIDPMRYVQMKQMLKWERIETR